MDEGAVCSAAAWYLALPLWRPLLLHGMVAAGAAGAASAAAGAAVQPHSS